MACCSNGSPWSKSGNCWSAPALPIAAVGAATTAGGTGGTMDDAAADEAMGVAAVAAAGVVVGTPAA
eukprot:15443460-Alexandrium_andersonii.AAC.1